MSEFPPVLILCGGLGTRVRSINSDLPKALIPINGEPFIAHQLKILAREKVKEVILCVGYKSEPLAKYTGSGNKFGLHIKYSYDNENGNDKLLGTGGAILKGSANLNTSFAVLYGDSYLDTEFAPIYAAFQKEKKLGLMTVFENKNQWIPSNILCQSNKIIAYNKKENNAQMQHVDYGLSIFQPAAFAAFKNRESFDLSEVFLDLIAQNQLAAYVAKDRFYEAGSPKGIAELEEYLRTK